MNRNIPIPKGRLQLNSRLPFDIFDQSGKLLLRRGTPLESQILVERLEEKGFFDPEAGETLRKAADIARQEEALVGYVPDRSGTLFSVFAELHSACGRLSAAIGDHPSDFEGEIFAVATIIRQCCSIDSDASLSALLHSLPFPHNVRHAVNVAILTTIVLLRQKHDEAKLPAAIAAALTMNIGALDLHEDLFFWTDALTDEQRAQVRAHPGAGVESLIARNVKSVHWIAIVAQHHEAIDGSGYPAGLSGAQILLEAQVVSLADRYCSMVAERAHRDPMLPPLAIKDIHARHGAAIAPALVGALVAAMGIYPPGTCVRLANGETAVVVHRLIDPKNPVVYAISGPNGMPYESARKRMTGSQPGFAIVRPVQRKEIEVPLAPEQLWPPTIAATLPQLKR